MKLTPHAAILLVACACAPAALLSQANGNVTEKPFAPGGRVELQLEGGNYEVRAAAGKYVRVTLSGTTAGARVDVTTSGTRADVKITNTPRNNFHARVDVPASSDLVVRLSGGNLDIAAVTGNKDIESMAGNVKVTVGDPAAYASVDASVKAGDIQAGVFGGSKSGLFQHFTWSGRGKYSLRAQLGAGNLELVK